MIVRAQEFENGQAVLHIEVEPAEMEKALEDAYRHLAKTVNIPGFRKGKAPRSVVESYVGKEALQQEALEDLIPRLCKQAAEEQDLDIIAPPEAEVLDEDPVVFKATFPLRPKVELGDYRSIRLDPEPVEVTEEQIQGALEHIRERHAVWEPVDRPLQFGDMATLDIEQRREGAGPTRYEGQQLPIIEGVKLPLPGFVDQLVGMEKGEEKEFTLSYPEDYEIGELANRSYEFKVKLTEVKEKQLPELDDEFARSLGEGLDSVDALRESVISGLRRGVEQRAKREFERRVVQAVTEQAQVEYPPVLLEREITGLLRERDLAFRGQGGLEAYLSSIGKTESQIKEELRPGAAERLRQSLVLGKLAEEEKIEVSEAEVDAEIEETLQAAYDYNKEDVRALFSRPEGRRAIWEEVLSRKTVERLAEIARGGAAEGQADEQVAEGSTGEEAGHGASVAEDSDQGQANG